MNETHCALAEKVVHTPPAQSAMASFHTTRHRRTDDPWTAPAGRFRRRASGARDSFTRVRTAPSSKLLAVAPVRKVLSRTGRVSRGRKRRKTLSGLSWRGTSLVSHSWVRPASAGGKTLAPRKAFMFTTTTAYLSATAASIKSRPSTPRRRPASVGSRCCFASLQRLAMSVKAHFLAPF